MDGHIDVGVSANKMSWCVDVPFGSFGQIRLPEQGSSEGAFLRYFSHQNPEKNARKSRARVLKTHVEKKKTHENYGHAFTFSIY